MEESIRKFILENKVANICFVCEDGTPYCISCFYAFDEKNNLLVLKSSTGTSHDTVSFKGDPLAGTIIPEQIEVMNLQGIQFQGRTIRKESLDNWNIATTYYGKFPFAMAMPGYLWAIELNDIKFTDNKKAFGTKIKWKK